MSQKSREREKERHPEVKPNYLKCSRTACENKQSGYIHKDTKLCYCEQCAHLINRECKQELVVKAPPLSSSQASLIALMALMGEKK